jgi:outer membrane protein assembly factor BamB
VPSSLLYDDKIYFLSGNTAVLSCLDARSGDVHYARERMGVRGDVYSSPVAVAGRLYVTSRDGTTKVVKTGEEYDLLATNELDDGDGFDASMAIVGDEIYLRGPKHLYCIAKQGE